MKRNRFSYFAWGVLVYNLGVVLWGAFVRATGSGAGCGKHWPLCNGEVIPRSPQSEMLVEFTHRLTSGLALVLVLGMVVWAYRSYPKGHPVRLGASLATLFMITEALVGAGLVLFGWVAKDESIGRAISIVVHLVNTFLLLAALTLTAWWASGGRTVQVGGDRLVSWLIGLGLVAVIILGASGALTALGDTLFPANSLAEGIQQDFSPTAHFLIRLRLLHPTIAIIVSIYLILLAGFLNVQGRSHESRTFSRALVVLIAVQVGAGLLNVYLLAPVWMQIVHLLLADLMWITLILYSASIFALAPANNLAQGIPKPEMPLADGR